MFGDGEYNFLGSWLDFILFAFFLFIGIWIVSGILNTRAGKKAESVFYRAINPIVKRYEELPFNLRRVVGGITFTVYFVGMVFLLMIMTN